MPEKLHLLLAVRCFSLHVTKIKRDSVEKNVRHYTSKTTKICILNLLEIQKGFQKFDKNGDGHITVEELQEARKKSEEEQSADHAKDMIKDVDRNGNMLSLKNYYPLYLYYLKFIMMEMDGFIPLYHSISTGKALLLAMHLSSIPGGKEERICLVILTWPLYCGQAERTEVYILQFTFYFLPARLGRGYSC